MFTSPCFLRAEEAGGVRMIVDRLMAQIEFVGRARASGRLEMGDAGAADARRQGMSYNRGAS